MFLKNNRKPFDYLCPNNFGINDDKWIYFLLSEVYNFNMDVVDVHYAPFNHGIRHFSVTYYTNIM
jgi:hypothetical protein